eukprot:TRINITY_DN9566_c0_g1_i2.p1 TRINITY_DN9566_c0_g1~~TRINITY_DN9566_c0_g1_i2.p1  ORF type:complete len:630 (-),score=137.85 TRINITY_DN9566_c0_g1_i2:37-1926(-)
MLRIASRHAIVTSVNSAAAVLMSFTRPLSLFRPSLSTKTTKQTPNAVKPKQKKGHISNVETRRKKGIFANAMEKERGPEDRAKLYRSKSFLKNDSEPEERDDVHARRFFDQANDEKLNDIASIRDEIYKFTLSTPAPSIKLNLDDVNVINIETGFSTDKIPKLYHHLDHIVHRPGIYPIDSFLPLQKDGGKFLKNIYQPEEIDFSRIPPYIPPSKDSTLLNFARDANIKYVMSTSTISSALAQIYYMFSGFRIPSFKNISSAYEFEPKQYMISQRKPVTTYLRPIDKAKDIWALDSDSGIFQITNSILIDLGKVIERSLTTSAEEFNSILLKGTPNPENLSLQDDYHRFMRLNNEICLRSQIDCCSLDPVTGKPFVFEIKSRSVCPIRYDLPNYKDYIDYKINSRRGLHSSFEREYYDMIRGAFLKWAFQIRIGRMDGAFVAFHNTKEIFGFEYIKTAEIERRVFGNPITAEVAFVCCSKLLITVLNTILADLKKESFEMLKVGFYACSISKRLVVFVELINESFEWGKLPLFEPTAEVRDEFDYYTKVKPFKNRVVKYDFHIYPYINGVLQQTSSFNLSEGDQVDIKYHVEKFGSTSFADYMSFLHEAYKMETIQLELAYSGVWAKHS